MAIKLALIAVLFAGFGMPLLKMGQLAGINAGQVLIVNGLSSALIGLISFKFINYPAGDISFSGMAIVVAATLILNVGFVLSNHSYSLGGLVSVIPIILSASQIISTPIGLFLLGESSKVSVPRLVFGMAIVLLGLILVSTSIKKV